MTSSRSTDWITDFTASHGMPPIAGAETMAGVPPAAAAPPPAAPAAPAPPPAAAPAPPAGQPPAPAPAAADPNAPVDPNAAPAAEPAAPEPPEWAQNLITRFDQIAPPPVDPMMVELGLVPPPGQPPAALDPSQVAPQGQPQGQPPAMPGQQPQQPGQLSEVELVQRLIDERATEQASRLIDERVAPLFAQQDATRRRGEIQSLQTDFPELAKPEAMQALFARAQSWSTTLFGNPQAAREPGFLEICHLAGKQLDAARAAGAVPATPGVPGAPGEVPVEQPGAATPGTPQTPEQELKAGIMAEKRGGGLSSVWVG